MLDRLFWNLIYVLGCKNIIHWELNTYIQCILFTFTLLLDPHMPFPQIMINLPGPHTWKKKTLAAIIVRPQRGRDSWTPLVHARMSTGLIFCKTCTGSHGSCEFINIMRLSCSEGAISYQPPLPTVFSSYSLLWWSLSLGVCEIYSLWVRT